MRYGVLAALLALGCAAPREAGQGAIRFVVHERDRVEVHGLRTTTLEQLASLGLTDTAWTSAIALYVEEAGPSAPPVLARYSLVGDVVHLVPRFPLATDVAYRVRVNAAVPAEHRFTLPGGDAPRTTRVVSVHPRAERIPANALRWYVEFSAPVERGDVLTHVRLLDAAGRQVEGAFLDVPEELWDPSGTRVTVLFDPGRVKRGVRTNLESGAPLVALRRYKLVVDAAWRDGRGAPLVSGYSHEFEAGPDDRESPDPARWRLTVPSAETRAPLGVAFGEPLDHALAARLISVIDASGRSVEGMATLAERDTAWSFVPVRAWARGQYRLRVDPLLEDLAGNNVAHVFDRAPRAVDTAGDRRTDKRDLIFVVP